MRSIRRHAFTHTHYSRAIGLAKEARIAAEAGKVEESTNLFKLSLGHLAESRDERAPATRREIEAELAKLTGVTTEPAPLASTRPDEDLFLEDVFPSMSRRRELEDELDGAHLDRERRKAGGGQ